MITPRKTIEKVLNSSYTPFSTLASSKASNQSPNKSAESSSQKKFSRKRLDSNDSNKNLARFEKFKKSLVTTKQQQPQQYEHKSSLNRTQQPVKKIQRRISKIQPTKYVRLSTDRSQDQYRPVKLQMNKEQDRHLRNKTERSEMIDYKIQFQIKNSELLILQDENNRLNNNLKLKQLEIKKTTEQIKQNYEVEIRGYKRRIQNLVKSVSEKEKQINQVKNKENQIKAQMSVIIKQNSYLKSELDLFMKKMLPKNVLQIQSYRQVSLMNQVKQLKKQINAEKSQRDRNIQNQMIQLREVCSTKNQECQSLQIANRVMKRKASSVDISLQSKAKLQVNQIKQKMKQKIKEISNLKKENMKLQKMMFENSKGKSLIRSNKKCNLTTESQDSFSFSLSR